MPNPNVTSPIFCATLYLSNLILYTVGESVEPWVNNLLEITVQLHCAKDLHLHVGLQFPEGYRALLRTLHIALSHNDYEHQCRHDHRHHRYHDCCIYIIIFVIIAIIIVIVISIVIIVDRICRHHHR